MNQEYFKKISGIAIFVILIVFSLLILRPLFLSIIFGIILAFIFSPVYKLINKKIKSRNLSAIILCVVLIILIALCFWFLTPILLDRSIKLYIMSQKIDFSKFIGSMFPSLFSLSEEFSLSIGSTLNSFAVNITNSLMNSLSNIILALPTLLLQTAVVFFSFFFFLRDGEEFSKYIKSSLPFPRDVQEKLFQSSKKITKSVIYGQIIIGLIQGIVVAIAFFLFKVSTPFLLSLLAVIAGILPIIGTAIVWIPVVIFLFISGNTFAAFGITLFGLFSSVVDNFLRPMFVSKTTRIHPGLAIVGMIGGFFLWGILGLILGPLVLSYLLIFFEYYRKKGSFANFLIQKEK